MTTPIRPQDAERMAEVMKAVAHPLRLRIVSILCVGDERVNDLAEKLDVKQALVSQQLRILRMSKLVAVKKNNGIQKYTLAEPRLVDLLNCVSSCGQ